VNKETVNMLMSYRQFVTESHKLANALRLKDGDSKHLLLVELLEHRLSNTPDEVIANDVANNSPAFSFKITYARKDVIRKHYRTLAHKAKAEEDLSLTSQDSYVIAELNPDARTLDDMEAALELLPTVFSNSNTRNWVAYVLKHGKEETMEHFSQSARAFTQKLNRVCKYANTHRERTIGLMASRNDSNEMHQLEALTQWANMMADEDVTDKQLQQYISQHGSLVASIVDTPKIKKQGKLVADWANADHADQYAFCNIMAERKAKLERYLTLR
jgi:hypothetical protein